MSRSQPGPFRKAVIPAAGAARRMQPLTLAVPKPLLPLGLRPLREAIRRPRVELALTGDGATG